MPITLNHLRGESQIVQQADFGTGDILLLACRNVEKEYENELWLIQNTPKPKSEWRETKDPNYEPGTITDKLPERATIALVFHDRDSITSMIRSLTELYNKMPAPEVVVDENVDGRV